MCASLSVKKRIDGQSNPDENKGDKLDDGKRFTKQENGHQKQKARRCILHQPNGGKMKCSGTGGVENERQGSQRAAKQQKEHVRTIRVEKMTLTPNNKQDLQYQGRNK